MTAEQERDKYRQALEAVQAHCMNYLSRPGSWNEIERAVSVINEALTLDAEENVPKLELVAGGMEEDGGLDWLMPCPFCGESCAVVGEICVSCDNCGATGPTSFGDEDIYGPPTFEWNTRVVIGDKL